MMMTRYIMIAGLIGGITISGCNSGKSTDTTTNSDVPPPATVPHTDTVGVSQKVSMVISSIPFPTNIFDSLHYVHGQYQNNMTNPTDNASTYSQSNAQAINLGIYGADLSYVISFEQFNQVGAYMKATKYLADKVGVPMAFTEDVIERCQKNSNNRDSLTRIVYSSYGVIDQKLKDDKRKSTEVLVLAGGWLEGLYITTESFSTISAVTDRQGAYNILMDQKRYLDLLLNQLDLISDSPYCTDISTGLHDIRSVYNNAVGTSMSNGVIQSLAEKAANLRARIIKGGSVQ
jgi:hypothetical protein